MNRLYNEHLADQESPPRDGGNRSAPTPTEGPVCDGAEQRSGVLHRPIDGIRRRAVVAGDAATELERYKLSLRRYAPVQRGIKGLPWEGRFHCTRCDQTVPGRFLYEHSEDRMYLEFDCPTCGCYRERYHDVLFVKDQPGRDAPRQPRRTHAGALVRPILRELPRTVETLCPECACNILGRYYVKDNQVFMDKTCPEHGYFRDKINPDVNLFLRGARYAFEDERGVYQPQVEMAHSCPSDCGLCNQHISTSCLAQIDLTNRCNLTCPVCFASAGAAGYVAEPSYEMVIEFLRSLRNQHPYPATAIQFTGGEPTLHPDFHRIIKTTNDMGFTHVQAATNGIALADREFAERAAEAGLHTLYLQFDGVDNRIYEQLRGRPMLETKLACIENCRRTGMKVCFVPTIVKNCNEDQVGAIFRFAIDNIDVVSAISYQPVAFTGRIDRRELEEKRYTLGDLAHDLAACSGADLERDFFPLSFIAPLSRILQTVDGKPKIRSTCHSDCAFGTYFFVTPDRRAIPMPRVFNLPKLFGAFNELAARINTNRPSGMANWKDKLDIALTFLRTYRWREREFGVTPFSFIRALRGLTNKAAGRGEPGTKTYRTLMAAGMHFMDRYNFDVERIRRCVILYSTPDGVYPFCTINGGPTYRPFLEKMLAQHTADRQVTHPQPTLRPDTAPNVLVP